VRVLLKMGLALSAAGLLLFGLYGLIALRAERGERYRSIRREVRLLGRSLRVAVENALRDRQLADVKEVLSTIEQVDASVDAAAYDAAGALIAASDTPPHLSQEERDVLSQAFSRQRTFVHLEPKAHPRRLFLAMPLEDQSGTLALIRPLEDLRENLRQARRRILYSVVLFVLVSSALSLALGAFYVSRPLTGLVDAIRRVRGGDLDATLAVPRRDEFGDLAAEFNDMVAELRRARQRIERETESREQLQHSLQQADKLITVGQLSAGLAHEIGSPLQVLSGRIRALLEHPDDAAETTRIGKILLSQSDRIARIVDQLVRFSRHGPAHIAPIDAVAAVREVLDLLEVEGRRRGVALTVEAASDLPALQADSDRLQQVVFNLVRNAIAATPRGGAVRVRMSLGELEVPSGGAASPSLRLAVEDSGTGIDATVHANLFEPFFTTRRADGGTGLGLAVVKSIVNEHGGSVSAESLDGAGSRFTVELPLRGPRGGQA
jgi:two-component system, NtrC family, sensor histidine kinase HydH